MKHFPALLLSAGLACALPLHALASEVQLGLNSQHSTVMPGGTTFVDVTVAYSGTDKLLGGGFSLSFDADLLELVEVTMKAPTDVAGTRGSLRTVGSVSTLTGVGFASFIGIGGSFDFATLEFKARGPSGVSDLALVDAQDRIYTWASESLEPVNVRGGLGTITVVPEPASMALLLAGLGVVATAASRRRPGQALSEAAATAPQAPAAPLH